MNEHKLSKFHPVQEKPTLVQEVVLPTEQATEAQAPTETATEQAAIIEQPPAQEPVDEPLPYFVEEFDADLENWTDFLTWGCEEEIDLRTDNGVLEEDFVDTKHNLQEGLIGLSVSSFDVLPILVEFAHFKISQP